MLYFLCQRKKTKNELTGQKKLNVLWPKLHFSLSYFKLNKINEYLLTTLTNIVYTILYSLVLCL